MTELGLQWDVGTKALRESRCKARPSLSRCLHVEGKTLLKIVALSIDREVFVIIGIHDCKLGITARQVLSETLAIRVVLCAAISSEMCGLSMQRISGRRVSHMHKEPNEPRGRGSTRASRAHQRETGRTYRKRGSFRICELL